MKPDVQDIKVSSRIKSSPAQQFFIEITSVFALAPTGFNFSLRT